MFFRVPPPMPQWPGPMPPGSNEQANTVSESRQGANPAQSAPAGQQPYYLPVLIPIAMPPGWNGGAPMAGLPQWPGQSLPGQAGQGGPQQQPQQAQATAQPGQQQGAAPTQTVPVVAGVEMPELPMGLQDRGYWYGHHLSRSARSRWTSGPIRSAWSL